KQSGGLFLGEGERSESRQPSQRLTPNKSLYHAVCWGFSFTSKQCLEVLWWWFQNAKTSSLPLLAQYLD
ncbi:MAG: hypothetical protein UEP78_00855, partial [Negativibacillus sp.]|nr:hypothetical protein [Negativibacillus sp.]